MSTNYYGYAGRVLKVNLSNQSFEEFPWTDKDRERTLGGKIMAADILYHHITPHLSAFDEENWIVVTTGPLTGNGCPSTSRFNISTISPLTNNITSSNCGGDFGIHLKKAGYDAVIFTGKSKKQVHIEITTDSVIFNNASKLWGLEVGPAQNKLNQKHGKLVIGPAGENGVLYAAVFSGERTAARGGVGAVFGDKNIKAVTAYGNCKAKAAEPEKLKELNKKWSAQLRNNPLAGNMLTKLGTASLVAPLQAGNMLATKNFSAGRYDNFDAVSGETLRDKHLIKNGGCTSCVIQCTRRVELDGKNIKGPEVETLGLLGPNIMNDNLEQIIRWNYELDELGIDTISAAGSIAFAMELNEKGMWDSGLEFGKIDNLSEVFRNIAYRRGIGDILADGTKKMSQRFGGEDFAMQVKGMELSAYEPRGTVGLGLGYATSNRGACHINGGYLVALEVFAPQRVALSRHSKAALSILFQDVIEVISSQGSCVFTAFGLIPPFLVSNPNGLLMKNLLRIIPLVGPFVNILNRFPEIASFNIPLIPYTYAITYATGMKMNLAKYIKIGKRGIVTERVANTILGQEPGSDKLPKRLTDVEQIPGKKNSKVQLGYMLKYYYKVRDWKDGIPTAKSLKRAGVDIPQYPYPY